MMETGDTEICSNLSQAILRGEYGFGNRSKIDEIARHYGVSHMPVRRVLQELAGDRQVTIGRNRGASVRAIDIGLVRESTTSSSR